MIKLNVSYLLGFILLFAGSYLSYSQQVITGKVFDSDGSPLPGVNIVVLSTNIGAQSDFDGNFTISASEGDTLVFSYIGYNQEQVVVGSSLEVEVQLQQDTEQLAEVVVSVGYGLQRKSDLTGSLSSIDGNDIARLPVSSLDAALQGRASGTYVSSPSGTPGSGLSIQIRGTTSISASSEPLYVIDGIPMISEELSGLFSGGQKTNSLADINPSDIASIEILKDASATAIYGSRGANGVVLVTTKRGESGTPRLEVNSYYGFSEVTNVIEMMTSHEHLQLMNDAARQDNRDLGTSYADNYISTQWGQDPDDVDLETTDWYGAIFRTAPIHSHDISLTGGNQRTKYFSSLAYYDQQGVQVGQGFKRFSARLNLDSEINNWLNIGSNILVSRTVSDRTINDNSLYGVVINTLAGDPLMPVFEEDGNYADPFDYFGWWMLDNPLLVAEQYNRFTKTTRGLGTIFAEVTFSDAIKFKHATSIDYTSVVDEAYTPSIARESSNASADGLGYYDSLEDFTWVTENYFTISPDLGLKHSLNAVLGTSFQASNRNFVGIDAQKFPSDQFLKLAVAAKITSGSTSGTKWGLSSYYFRLNYGFDNKYLVTLTGRSDGSSRFGEENRFGFFPSGSVAWRVNQEDFLKDSAFISNLKLRGSYGITGNQDGIGNFASRGLYGIGSYRSGATLVPTQLSNQSLGWESTSQLNFGIDLGILDNQLNITADYFIKNTSDLLLNRRIPGISGFSSVTDNIGEVENKGLEFLISGRKDYGDLTIESSFNVSFIKNEIKSLAINNQVISDSHVLSEGHPIGTFYLIDQDGVDPQTGNIRWKDTNNDGEINNGDRTIVGNARPDYFGGSSTSIEYKGFELHVVYQFIMGQEVFNHSRASYENLGFNRLSGSFVLPDGNNHVLAKNRWKEPGDVTDIPRASLTQKNWREYSTRWLEDGSFVRLKTITLGYDFHSDMLEKLKINRLRLYLQGQNLLTLTNYTGLDPEISQNARDLRLAGSDFGTLPQTRSVVFGISVGI